MSSLDYDQRYRPNEEPYAERLHAVVEAPTPSSTPSSTPGPTGRRQFEYRSGSVEGGRLETILNDYGKEGWRLRFCIPHKTAAGFPNGTFVVILERELTPNESDPPVP